MKRRQFDEMRKRQSVFIENTPTSIPTNCFKCEIFRNHEGEFILFMETKRIKLVKYIYSKKIINKSCIFNGCFFHIGQASFTNTQKKKKKQMPICYIFSSIISIFSPISADQKLKI